MYLHENMYVEWATMVTLVCQEYLHCVIQPKWVDIAWPINASHSTPNGARCGLQMVPPLGFQLMFDRQGSKLYQMRLHMLVGMERRVK